MKKIIVLFIGIAALALVSCESFLDINEDPNSPAGENLTPSLIFPGAEMNLCNEYGNFLRINGGYLAQHYGHQFGTSNYIAISRWLMADTRCNRNYTQLSTKCLKNMETIRSMATASEEWGTNLAATVIRGFAYQVLVDTYGEVPYTEALQGGNNLTPKFDDGLDIYKGILAELDDALSKVSANNVVCTNFLFGTSSVTEWIQLANALKLRMLMRMREVSNSGINVSSELATLIAEGNFPGEDVAWAGIWSNESGKANPFWQEEFFTGFGSNQVNVTMNIALVKTMEANNDGRLAAIASANGSGNYTGSVSGTNFSTAGSDMGAAYWNRPRIVYNTPVYLITLSEIEFFLAEYYAAVAPNAAAAEAHYEAAVEASFETLGIGGADDVLAANPWNQANWKQLIGIQKWLALSGVNNHEAWCELRRLKFPAFGTVTGAQLYNEATRTYSPDLYVPGTLYDPITKNANLNANTVLQRWPYPETATSNNSNAPKNTDLDCNRPVFWAQ